MFFRITTAKTLIRLLLKKQSDLGLHSLSGPFWQATSVRNFRKFTVMAEQRCGPAFIFVQFGQLLCTVLYKVYWLNFLQA